MLSVSRRNVVKKARKKKLGVKKKFLPLKLECEIRCAYLLFPACTQVLVALRWQVLAKRLHRSCAHVSCQAELPGPVERTCPCDCVFGPPPTPHFPAITHGQLKHLDNISHLRLVNHYMSSPQNLESQILFCYLQVYSNFSRA